MQRRFIGLLDMDVADACGTNEAEPACASPDAEPAATRIVSNLPTALRGSPGVQADPSCEIDDDSGSWESASDEDDDEDEDLDELADDKAVLEEELELGAWDPAPPAGFPDYMHGVSPFCLTP